jgi:ribosome maturation factor RimP
MVEEIRNLIEPEIVKAGYILDDVIYEKEDNVNYLRIVIDKEKDYITIDDCVIVNDIINPIIDENEPIEESYMLEVWSKEKEGA